MLPLQMEDYVIHKNTLQYANAMVNSNWNSFSVDISSSRCNKVFEKCAGKLEYFWIWPHTTYTSKTIEYETHTFSLNLISIALKCTPKIGTHLFAPLFLLFTILWKLKQHFVVMIYYRVAVSSAAILSAFKISNNYTKRTLLIQMALPGLNGIKHRRSVCIKIKSLKRR